MKKKLLTLAVAAALPMAAATSVSAEVTIYGKIHASIDGMNYDTTGLEDQWDVSSRASRIGFKGSEDLGNGTKVIWKAETQMSISEGGGQFATRNAYIGLAGGFGTFLYGRHDTPVKMSTGKLDIFGDTIADYNLGNQTGKYGGLVDIRANDAIAYVSPSFGGLTLVGAVVPDADYDGTGDFGGGYSIAGMYSNGGLFIGGGYENIDDLAGGANLAHWRIGAGFDMSSFHIGAVYQQADGGFAPNGEDFDTITVNGSLKFGNNALKAMWLRTSWDNNLVVGDFNDDTADSWAIGLDHSFSKRSKIYVIYANSDVNLHVTNFDGGQKGISMGMTHKF